MTLTSLDLRSQDIGLASYVYGALESVKDYQGVDYLCNNNRTMIGR